MTTRIKSEESGQALVELSFGLIMLCIFVCGIVDYGRAIYDYQVMKNLVGEGSSLASRGNSLASTVTTVTTDAGRDISIGTSGCVVVTTVTNMGGGSLQVTDQASGGGISCTGLSKIGCLSGQGGCRNSSATLPPAAVTALTSEVTGSAIYVTEIFYNYSTITPLPAMLGTGGLPTQLYSAAYY